MNLRNILILLLVIIIVGFTYVFVVLKTENSDLKVDTLIQETTLIGSIETYRLEEGKAIFRLSASGNTKDIEMKYWKDGEKEEEKQWQPFNSMIEVDSAGLDYVYVRFKDTAGNISPVYQDSIHPNAPGKLAE